MNPIGNCEDRQCFHDHWKSTYLPLLLSPAGERVGVYAMGLHNLEAHGIHSYLPDPHTPANGLVAVSEHAWCAERAKGGWWWLEHQPYERIGKSIRLYRLP